MVKIVNGNGMNVIKTCHLNAGARHWHRKRDNY